MRSIQLLRYAQLVSAVLTTLCFLALGAPSPLWPALFAAESVLAAIAVRSANRYLWAALPILPIAILGVLVRRLLLDVQAYAGGQEIYLDSPAVFLIAYFEFSLLGLPAIAVLALYVLNAREYWHILRHGRTRSPRSSRL